AAGSAGAAVLPAAPVLAPPLLLLPGPRPPPAVRPSSLPAGPTGRSPPAAVSDLSS
ncbi:MAG: hypothetical protein JWN17_489, partial [Frankiales bacterium]|nr:hypothetical protein [Frankiales bacterium]